MFPVLALQASCGRALKVQGLSDSSLKVAKGAYALVFVLDRRIGRADTRDGTLTEQDDLGRGLRCQVDADAIALAVHGVEFCRLVGECLCADICAVALLASPLVVEEVVGEGATG